MQNKLKVAVIGGGPAGLMAAEVISQHGLNVDVYDAMPSVGRKFLMAGKGGMNITHAEPSTFFFKRYGQAEPQITPWLAKFGAQDIRQWMRELGVDSFIGSSGRVFPSDMKAAPLLRAWLHRLRSAGVRFHMRHRWQGWHTQQHLLFETPDGLKSMTADAVLLALGGGSWAKLGSDGLWVTILQTQGIGISALKPSNCGFDSQWSGHFSVRFAGHALKNVAIQYTDLSGLKQYQKGECLITQTGIEGGLIYAISSVIREQIQVQQTSTVHLDLLPDVALQAVLDAVTHPRGSRSISSHLQSRLGLKGVKAGLLRECLDANTYQNAWQLGHAIKALPLTLIATRPMNEAISTAGGVQLGELNDDLMLHAKAGVFCAGEMLDWDAPTGGYLLTACFASGYAAGHGVVKWLNQQNDD